MLRMFNRGPPQAEFGTLEGSSVRTLWRSAVSRYRWDGLPLAEDEPNEGTRDPRRPVLNVYVSTLVHRRKTEIDQLPHGALLVVEHQVHRQP